jgi:hypothetical protein
MTVKARPSISRVRPIAAGSRPKRRCQSGALNTATGDRSRSSASPKTRPRAGETPIVLKKLAVTNPACRGSGSSAPPNEIRDQPVFL